MKSKRAEEYLDRKSPVKTVGDRKFYYPISRLEAEKAIELAEQEAEERIEALKARAVEAFRESCPIKHPGLNDKGTLCDKINIIGFDCNCPASDCKFLLNFIQKLNEQ